jgi:hypothetical protein
MSPPPRSAAHKDKEPSMRIGIATDHGGFAWKEDPHWRDLIQFHEYFYGDNGAGLGASHQTGWTGIVARMMHLFASTTPGQALELGKLAGFTGIKRAYQSQ